MRRLSHAAQPPVGLDNKRKFAGALIQGWKAYNITPDHDWGIGSWSDEQLEGYLSAGHAEGRGSAGGPMSEVVDNSLRYLTGPDIKAIAAYLKSVPADGDGTDVAAAPTPAAPREVSRAAGLASTKADRACTFSKAPASAVTNSTARAPSRNYASLVGREQRTIRQAPTPPRRSSAARIY